MCDCVLEDFDVDLDNFKSIIIFGVYDNVFYIIYFIFYNDEYIKGESIFFIPKYIQIGYKNIPICEIVKSYLKY